MNPNLREQVIAEYHTHLANDPSLTPDLFARLKSGMAAYHMLYGQRELGVSLRPHFLTRTQYDRLAYCAQQLNGAMETLGAALLSDADRLDQIGLTEKERALVEIDHGASQIAITTRVDSFVIDDQVRFVEYNGETPSSILDQAGLNQILFEVRALQNVAERHRMYQFRPEISLLQSLLETWREWGGKGTPRIAILDWEDLPTSHEFLLLRNYFVSCGVPTIICTPDEIEYQHDKLQRGDFKIDLVYKRVVIHEFLSKYDLSHPLVRAYANHDVCLINSFRCKLLHKKATFEFLTDEANQHWFTPSQQTVLHDCVPWTRRVQERMTQHLGREVDLIEYIRKNRALFILKPNDDYGGRGIFFGNLATETQWDEAIAKALHGDYIVQELVSLYQEEFPVFTTEDWGFQPMYVDTNPFLFRGTVHGAMVRLATTPIVNVTSGGGETGFFVLEKE